MRSYTSFELVQQVFNVQGLLSEGHFHHHGIEILQRVVRVIIELVHQNIMISPRPQVGWDRAYETHVGSFHQVSHLRTPVLFHLQ